jgi:hypothetical protein
MANNAIDTQKLAAITRNQLSKREFAASFGVHGLKGLLSHLGFHTFQLLLRHQRQPAFRDRAARLQTETHIERGR